jgi:hypothetical protein
MTGQRDLRAADGFVASLAGGTLDPQRYGWKAYYLAFLGRMGSLCPGGFAVAVDAPPDVIADQVRMMVPPRGDGTARLAVRSSGINEDSLTDSQAGQNLTRVVDADPALLLAAIAEVRHYDPTNPVAAVIQPFVDGHWAGVAFSTDPLEYDKDTVVVEWVEGVGAELVGGRGFDGRVVLRSTDPLPGSSRCPLSATQLDSLRTSLSKFEAVLHRPVDVEWVLALDGSLVFVQVRPVVLPNPGLYSVDSEDDFTQLPGIIATHPKLAVRRAATRLGIPLDGATVVVRAVDNNATTCPASPAERYVAAKSVVLLHPSRVDSRVVREFGAINADGVGYFTSGCRRYAVRDYPPRRTFRESVARLLSLGGRTNWVPVVVVKDVLCADITGIARVARGGIVIELSQGHFVPKGIVATSVFLCEPSGQVLTIKQDEQNTAYRFVNGHIVTESPVAYRVDYTDELIAAIAQTVAPLLKEFPQASAEFGVIARNGDPFIYLIDWAEGDSSELAPTPTDLSEGILSTGVASGQVHVVEGTWPGESQFDSHLGDTTRHFADDVPTVYLCDRPSTDLLSLIRVAPRGSGFIFRSASMLCHVAVVLRERGLAAISVDQDTWIKVSQWQSAVIQAGRGNVDVRAGDLDSFEEVPAAGEAALAPSPEPHAAQHSERK